MKRILTIVMMAIALLGAQAQTVHSLLFSNKEERGRESDRTEDLMNMSSFCTKIAEMLDYRHNMKQHSGSEFTSTQFLNDLDYINVQEGDIVIFWYNGHGANWDDGDWPHMAFKDRQYSEQTAFDKLKAKCSNAKLILCFADCCNMDSQGRRNPGNAYYSGWSYKKVKELFTEFVGKKRIITSSSKRGQYSYSWTGGSKLGSIYGISFREAMDVVLNSMSSMPVTWENVLETAKRKTMNYTSNHKEGSQVPQYKIEGGELPPPPPPTPSYHKEMSINFSFLQKTDCQITFSIEIENIYLFNGHKGRLDLYLESPKGVKVPYAWTSIVSYSKDKTAIASVSVDFRDNN